MDVLDFKKALPNKMFDENGKVTTIQGNEVTESIQAYENMPSLPNKFLNPDGSYSTLNEILAGIVDTDLFVIVPELPETGLENKIYLVPNGKGTFDEYHYHNGKWDPIGTLDISNLATTEQVQQALEDAKQYTDQEIKKIVPLYPFPESFKTNGTTQEFVDSVLSSNLPVGGMYLGEVILTDMPDENLHNAEVKVEVYDNSIVYFTMTSADLSPYQWTCNSWQFRGWEPSGIQAAKDYTDKQIKEKITDTLEGVY